MRFDSSMLAVTIFSFIILALIIYAHFSFKRHFLRDFKLNRIWLYAFDAFLLFSAYLKSFYRLQNGFAQHPIPAALINLSFVLLGLSGLLILWLIILDLTSLMARKVVPGPNLERRLFFKQVFSVTGVAAAGVSTLTSYSSSFDPEVKETDIPLKSDHQGLKGLRIVQLSDVHIGPSLGKDFAEKVVARVNSMRPDIIAITGDMIDGYPEYLREGLSPFKQLSAPMGVFFVAGNHEYYWGGDIWHEEMRLLGMIPLVNEHRVLSYKGSPVAIAGVTDLSTLKRNLPHPHDPAKAALGIPEDVYKILLAHKPESCREARPHNYHLQLSGHTHAGQGYPWRFIASFVHKYLEGLYDHEGMWVYVNAGTGFWGPPNRLGVRSEISLLRLV